MAVVIRLFICSISSPFCSLSTSESTITTIIVSSSATTFSAAIVTLAFLAAGTVLTPLARLGLDLFADALGMEASVVLDDVLNISSVDRSIISTGQSELLITSFISSLTESSVFFTSKIFSFVMSLTVPRTLAIAMGESPLLLPSLALAKRSRPSLHISEEKIYTFNELKWMIVLMNDSYLAVQLIDRHLSCSQHAMLKQEEVFHMHNLLLNCF